MNPDQIVPRRRQVWHWLADHCAPTWLWALFVGCTWRRCATCGVRGVGHWKPASVHGGGQPTRYWCGRHMRDSGPF